MTQSPSPNDRLIAEARRAIEQDRPADARPLLERAVRQDAGDPRPWLLLAGIATTPRERRAYLAQARRLDANTAVHRPTAAPPPTAAPRPRRALWPLAALALLLAAAALLAFHPTGRALLQDLTGRVAAQTSGGEPVATPVAEAAVASPLPLASPTTAVEVASPSPTAAPVFPTKAVAAGVDANGQPLPTWTPTPLPTPTLAPTLTPSPTPTRVVNALATPMIRSTARGPTPNPVMAPPAVGEELVTNG